MTGHRTTGALRAGAVTVLLTCLAVLAGCTTPPGGDPAGPTPAAAPPPAPRAVVAGAVRSLAEAGSARVELATDPAAGAERSAGGTGIGPGRSAGGTGIGAVRASGPMRFAPFAADLTVTVGTREAQVRAVGGNAWVRLGGSGRWQPLATGLLPLGAVGGAVRAAPGLTDVTGQGREQVGTVPAVRYGGTVDLAAAKAAAPADAARIDELAGLVSPTPRFTAWIGAADAPAADRGRLLRLRLEPSAGPSGPQVASAPVPGAVTVGFTEPGLPVDVTAPE